MLLSGELLDHLARYHPVLTTAMTYSVSSSHTEPTCPLTLWNCSPDLSTTVYGSPARQDSCTGHISTDLLLTCSPSAKHWAPWPVISFCQRDNPSNVMLSLSASPMNWALASVKPLVPTSRVKRVLLRTSATRVNNNNNNNNHYYRQEQNWLLILPPAKDSIPSSPISHLLSERCSKTLLFSKTSVRQTAPSTPICKPQITRNVQSVLCPHASHSYGHMHPHAHVHAECCEGLLGIGLWLISLPPLQPFYTYYP